MLVSAVLAKWFSYTYIHSFSDSFPTWVITEYWMQFPLSILYIVYVVLRVYSSPTSQFIPLPAPFPLGNYKLVFHICDSISVLQIHSFVPIFLDPICKWYHMIFVFVWLTSLSMISPRSIHVGANDIMCSFLWLNNIPLYISTCSLYMCASILYFIIKS